ncbi:hypothetical protein [Burkholderia sp. S171]|uniref:HalD/BesD family halogenase n=1 Tax=Burkholderia sp. S171 TaxID=1641860 RepID=UPI00131A6973|nr:hypothetical protein [Burkholderia sp. S171]
MKPPDTQIALNDLVNVQKYPIYGRDDPLLQEKIGAFREELELTGCAVIRDFIRPERIEVLQNESRQLSRFAYFSHRKVNPYATQEDLSLNPDDPRRTFQAFSNGFVARDVIPPGSITSQLYHDLAFQRFVADVLNLTTIHEYADPIAGLVINVMPDGSALPWHFDTNDFVVSLLTIKPDDGGLFEYCNGLRSQHNENFPTVKSVLNGDRKRVVSLELQPGDVQLFKGRNSLHRVTSTTGERHTLLFGYATQPGVIGRAERTRVVYGRVHKAHLEAEARSRADGLLD